MRASDPRAAPLFLATERLILRRFTPEDHDALVGLDADPEVMRYVTGGVPEYDASMLEAWLEEYRHTPGYGCWAAEDRESRAFIGWFHLRPLDEDDRTLELGYRLRRSTWGHGYASEGSRALVDRAFADQAVGRVVAYALAIHGASRRVMEKAGLRFMRTFHADWPYPIRGDEHGDVEYAITREEWLLGSTTPRLGAGTPLRASRSRPEGGRG